MRVAGLVEESVVDGPGIRFVVFTQGCPLACRGCHNPETQDPCGGVEMSVDELCRRMRSAELATGLSLSGGEPTEQPDDCARVAAYAHTLGFDVWCWSGRTVETLVRRSASDPALVRLLEQVDVLVDGPFVLPRRTLGMRWRGSTNQRLIDLPATLQSGRPVCLADHPRGQRTSP